MALVIITEIYMITVTGSKVKIMLENWREAGSACGQGQIKHMDVVLRFAFIRQELSPL